MSITLYINTPSCVEIKAMWLGPYLISLLGLSRFAVPQISPALAYSRLFRCSIDLLLLATCIHVNPSNSEARGSSEGDTLAEYMPGEPARTICEVDEKIFKGFQSYLRDTKYNVDG